MFFFRPFSGCSLCRLSADAVCNVLNIDVEAGEQSSPSRPERPKPTKASATPRHSLAIALLSETLCSTPRFRDLKLRRRRHGPDPAVRRADAPVLQGLGQARQEVHKARQKR